jgi:broad specificity phosphatase PhoE
VSHCESRTDFDVPRTAATNLLDQTRKEAAQAAKRLSQGVRVAIYCSFLGDTIARVEPLDLYSPTVGGRPY